MPPRPSPTGAEATAPRSRSTTRSAPQASESASASRNSSPPIRPQTSPGRSSPCSTRAAIRSASSPAACPTASFMRPKWSRSSTTTATFASRSRAPSSVSCSASCSPRWLSAPVERVGERQALDAGLQRALGAAQRVQGAGQHARRVPPVPAERRLRPAGGERTAPRRRAGRAGGRLPLDQRADPDQQQQGRPAAASSTSRRPAANAVARSSSMKPRRSTASARPRPSTSGKVSDAEVAAAHVARRLRFGAGRLDRRLHQVGVDAAEARQARAQARGS